MTEQSAADLAAELAKPDYSGKAAADVYADLFQPRVTTTETPTGLRLNATATARLVGVAKAEAIAAAMKQAFPNTAGYLISEGVDPLAAETVGFFEQLMAANVLSQADLDAIHAAAVTTTTTTLPPRMYDVFFGVAGFPNHVERAEFDAAWLAAGRTL